MRTLLTLFRYILILTTFVFFGGVLVILVAFAFLEPSHDRDWAPEHARLTEIDQLEGVYNIRNVRDWRYDAEQGVINNDYRELSLRLDELQQAWFLVEPFGELPGVGHTMFSFQFEDGTVITFSVEARREHDEGYRAYKGLVPTYELIYLVTTEQDMLTESVIKHNDQVLLYRLTIPLNTQRILLRSLFEEAQMLETNPRFYHLFASNCTTILADAANLAAPGSVPLHYSWLLPGFSDKYLYDLGYLDTSISFAQLQAKADVSSQIRQLHTLDDATEFSQRLRQASLQP